MEQTQVVVVGAGPVGLMLAGELRLGGAEVVVLEESTEPTTESRASTLHARTMEILDSRGLLDRVGTPPNEPRGHFGGLPIDLTLPTPYPGQWKVLQTRTEQVLQDWVCELGADIRRGHEVRHLAVFDDHVDVDGLRAEYVVGCDGEHSTVRRLIGAEFAGADATRELIRSDIAGVDVAARRFQRLDRGFATAGKLAGGVTRVMVHEFGTVPKGVEPTFGDLVDTWRRVTGEDVGGGTPLWVNGFDDTSRQLTRYRHGRVLFAGDAAHRQLPVGGQALNLGVQDAANLGWKLAAQVVGRASPGLLDSYHDERHAVGRRTLDNIRAQAQLLFGGPEVEPLREILRELIAEPSVVTRLAGMISGLDIRYDLGPHPLLGRRISPDHVGMSLRGGGGALLLSEGVDDVRRAALPWSDVVNVVEVEPDPTLPSAVLVRPDGHAAWVSDGDEPLSVALPRWFGPPPSLHTCEASR
jgi:2-polyprenyl-6-methoxyphenol hydroxylase-like FAD-dependent oxidoreductase